MSVYCVYTAYPESDGWPVYSLISICTTENKAKELISTLKKQVAQKPVHSTMDETNNYTYVGYRDECSHNYINSFGGYVIELTEMDKIIK